MDVQSGFCILSEDQTHIIPVNPWMKYITHVFIDKECSLSVLIQIHQYLCFNIVSLSTFETMFEQVRTQEAHLVVQLTRTLRCFCAHMIPTVMLPRFKLDAFLDTASNIVDSRKKSKWLLESLLPFFPLCLVFLMIDYEAEDYCIQCERIMKSYRDPMTLHNVCYRCAGGSRNELSRYIHMLGGKNTA